MATKNPKLAKIFFGNEEKMIFSGEKNYENFSQEDLP